MILFRGIVSNHFSAHFVQHNEIVGVVPVFWEFPILSIFVKVELSRRLTGFPWLGLSRTSVSKISTGGFVTEGFLTVID